MFLDINTKPQASIAAIDDSGLSVTYGELVDFSTEFSSHINKRDLIFILSENSVASFMGYAASLVEKIVPLIISNTSDDASTMQLIETYSPKFIWLPKEKASNLGYRIIFSKYNYSLVCTEFKSPKLHKDLSMLLPTSGSTGSSKLVRHSYKNIEANARNVAKFSKITSSDRALVILPMHYTMGLSIITSNIYMGATVLLVKRNMLQKEFWSFFKDSRATSITGVPYSFEIMTKLRFTRMKFPDLKLISQGGGKLNPDTFKLYARYAEDNDIRFLATYGQTECTARMAYLPSELALEKTCSIGRAIPNGRLYLIDEEGNTVNSNDVVGELVYEGENVTLGYAFTSNDLLLGDVNKGIIKTGDLAKSDSDGCYYIEGRKGRFLKLYGHRIGLDECEQIVKMQYGIECACVGNDKKMNVYIEEKEYLDRVLDLLSSKTGIISLAFQVLFIDSLPKNEAGKILYKNLK